MKKRFIAAILLLVFVLITPKIISSQTQNRTLNFVESIKERIETGHLRGYTIDVLSYDAGWFSSQAQYKLTINYQDIDGNSNIPENLSNPTFVIDVTSYHGPIFLSTETGFGWVRWDARVDGEKLRDDLTWDDDRGFYESTTTWELFGGWSVNDSVAAFRSTEVPDTSVEFSGYQGTGYSSHEGFNYDASIAFFRANTPKVSINLDNFKVVTLLKGDFTQILEGNLEDSHLAMSVQSYKQTAKQAGNQSGEFQNVEWLFSAVTNQDKNSMSFTQRFSIEEFQLAEYRAKNLLLDAEISSISKPFIDAYQNFSQQLPSYDPATQQMEVKRFIQSNMLELLSHQPEFNIKELSGNLPEGQFTLVSDSTLVGVTALPESLEDPKFWLEHLDSQSNLIADEAVIKLIAQNYMTRQILANPRAAQITQEQLEQLLEQQLPVMLQTLEQQGMLVKENDVYKVDFTIKDGEAVLNGTPMPLPF
ncbi:MAG: hypothetical protein Alis3KO_26230 [Aliiglaciecola sp.]|uniref:DUF945 family protein n=1 Tax=Aliiglaciecola sp. M165 TaxID=2593649 RepID=UPI0011812178|nr:DUF945 family protein [Aliiglaciecola sp. M165]TRY30736.1 DUF945 domain-containing protein [Aliiglaciecola sp. M165]